MARIISEIAVAGVLLSLGMLLASSAHADPTPPAAATQYPSPGNVPNSNCDPEEIDFTPFTRDMYVGQTSTFTVDACLNADPGLEVRLVEVDGAFDDTLEGVTVSSVFESVRIVFSLECVDGGVLPNKLVGHDSFSQDIGGEHKLSIETDYAGLGLEKLNSDDNVLPNTGEATVRCLDAPTSGGGIAEPIALGSDSAADTPGSSSARDYTAPIAAAAGVAGVLAIAAGGWYVRRRFG